MAPFLAPIFASPPSGAASRATSRRAGTASRNASAAAALASLLIVTSQAVAGNSSKPVASNDAVSMADGEYRFIDVLSNDSGLNETPVEIAVISQPADGSAWRMDTGESQSILVHTNPGASGIDSFVYEVSDANGDKSIATVQLDVSCTNQCGTVSLGWNAGPATVTGYRVFFGATPATATSEIFDMTGSSVTFNAISRLGLGAGDPMCFRIKSYNAAAESGFSDAVCGTL